MGVAVIAPGTNFFGSDCTRGWLQVAQSIFRAHIDFKRSSFSIWGKEKMRTGVLKHLLSEYFIEKEELQEQDRTVTFFVFHCLPCLNSDKSDIGTWKLSRQWPPRTAAPDCSPTFFVYRVRLHPCECWNASATCTSKHVTCLAFA